MKNIFAASLFSLVLVGTGCSTEPQATTRSTSSAPVPSVSSSPITPTPVPIVESAPAKAKIVFGADFAKGTGCSTHNSEGCDIYSAEIAMDGSVSAVKQLTTEDRVEAFPVFSADGTMMYTNRFKQAAIGDIEYVSLVDGKTGILQADALSPAPMPDGKTIGYINANGLNVMLGTFATPMSLVGAEALTTDGNYHETHASQSGNLIMSKLFGAGRGSNTAQAKAFNVTTRTMIDLTESDGTAHCFWNWDGSGAMCNNSEKYRGILVIPFDGVTAGAGKTFVTPIAVKKMIAINSDFAACLNVNYAYGTFCDENHMIVTAGCETETPTGRDTLMSQLVLIDFSTSPQTVLPLGKNLSDSFGGPGIASHTVSCMME